ncbi:MAG: sigma-70 family RNA polymerase sigma factor [Nitrospirae bacterium]|nr:sigma-70 family RNA polymerase sigma factor [Nitrospirota bacterium]
MDESESKIMAEVAKGDLSAFREIVDRYQNPLLNYIFRYTGDRAASEDIAQEVFLRVFKAAKDYRLLSSFKTWLFKIATNLCLNELRDNRIHRNTIDIFELNEAGFVFLAAKCPSPARDLENRELSSTLKNALKSLPEKQRVALLLHKYSGFSYFEISQMMNCSISAVESLIHRARQRLRKQLTPYL